MQLLSKSDRVSEEIKGGYLAHSISNAFYPPPFLPQWVEILLEGKTILFSIF